jgi:protein-S-isoprenylcysteine O-methyltransferase Ste14
MIRNNVKKILHVSLRAGFGICLFLSQFPGSRTTFFTDNPYMLVSGVLVFVAGVLLVISASKSLGRDVKENKIAISGPYRYIRHPIYTSIYILTTGLGLIFFTWLWYMVMIAFIPLWYLECRKEEKEMIKVHGQEYIDYRKRTGMFLPGLQ